MIGTATLDHPFREAASALEFAHLPIFVNSDWPPAPPRLHGATSSRLSKLGTGKRNDYGHSKPQDAAKVRELALYRTG